MTSATARPRAAEPRRGSSSFERSLPSHHSHVLNADFFHRVTEGERSRRNHVVESNHGDVEENERPSPTNGCKARICVRAERNKQLEVQRINSTITTSIPELIKVEWGAKTLRFPVDVP